jgi:hypothetical protein
MSQDICVDEVPTSSSTGTKVWTRLWELNSGVVRMPVKVEGRFFFQNFQIWVSKFPFTPRRPETDTVSKTLTDPNRMVFYVSAMFKFSKPAAGLRSRFSVQQNDAFSPRNPGHLSICDGINSISLYGCMELSFLEPS